LRSDDVTKIAAVIGAGSPRDAERESRGALSRGADLVELRLDYLDRLDSAVVRHLSAVIGTRGIATLRSAAEGGRERPAGERDRVLKEIAAQRFAYLDIELDADQLRAEEIRKVAKGHRTEVIASHHFSNPADLSVVRDSVESCAAIGDIAKVAVPVADVESAIQLVDLARERARRRSRTILIGTGIAGMITRALANETGQEIQYASWGGAVASGQLPLGTAKRLGGRTPIVLGLVGHPIRHSISPSIHEAALAALDLPGVYLPFDVGASSLDSILQAADRLRVHGLNVTIPYKEAIVEKVDELDGDAERLGAVNTVVLADGWRKGHNTDVFGFRLSLRSLGLRVGGRRVLVVGAGGAAKAVVDVLLREGATVQVTGRNAKRAEALADVFDGAVDSVPLDALPKSGPWDVLVNATPVGAEGFASGLPVSESILTKVGFFVYDLVYNPPTTPLVAAAMRLGKPATSGLEMLLHQAAKSFELWTGRSPPVEAMRRAAKEALS
jgi:shikimate dehydrogenase/3-dehydroquinate dehydratase type I